MIFYSEYQSIYLILPLIGFLLGLFGTMLGGGGGFFFLPVLTLIIGAPAQVAVPTSLTATLPIGLVGTIGHFRRGNVDFKTGKVFVLAGIVGALAGAAITGYISSKQLKIAFGVYSILIALNMSFSTWKKKKCEVNGEELKELSPLSRIFRGSFFGLFAGAISGTFGTSGTAPVMAGLFSMRLSLKMVVGTSLLIILINAMFAIGAHFLVGRIDLTLVGFLTSGSVVGALIGTRWLSRIKVAKAENNIRHVYALVMIVIGILMILK
ncbi:sulfite exporter TauE/SafE family protein [Maribellus mangrovi]|uniref:sulfite exporter TauE/SafE family protein n=1 Tax=Maribellus mangrovi TaxID=3133146 RepID=UPI0030EC8B63